MKFLAIDTSGSKLSVVAVNGETVVKNTNCDCARLISVRLMGEIEDACRRAHMRANECDFFACTVGPGSFTGIRIGIATVKGLCFACKKPALAVTSFEAAAYAETGRKRLVLVGAGHSNYYACGFGEENEELFPPAFLSEREAEEALARGFQPVHAEETDLAEGLYRAALAKRGRAGGAEELTALYLRKSSAEERR